MSAPEPSPADLLFDFAGFLTSHSRQWVFSASADAAPAIDAIREFAERRGINLNDVQALRATPAAAAELREALSRISLAEADSTTSAPEKVRDMARIARAALATPAAAAEPVAWWRHSYIDEQGNSDADVQIGANKPTAQVLADNGFPWQPLYGQPLATPAAAADNRPIGQFIPGFTADESMAYFGIEPTAAPNLTDAKLSDIADDFKSQYTHGGTTFDEFDYIGFARRILATPAAAAEPTDEELRDLAIEHGFGTLVDGVKGGVIWFDSNPVPMLRALALRMAGKP